MMVHIKTAFFISINELNYSVPRVFINRDLIVCGSFLIGLVVNGGQGIFIVFEYVRLFLQNWGNFCAKSYREDESIYELMCYVVLS